MSEVIYSTDHRHIVEKLIQARLDIGLSQTQTAELLRRSQSYVSKLESGQRRVDAVLLKILARIYKKPVEFFLK